MSIESISKTPLEPGARRRRGKIDVAARIRSYATPLTRTQILLEPDQHRALTELARRQNRSLSELVRAIVSQELEQQARAQAEMLRQRQQTLERITRHRAVILDRRGGQSLEIDVGGEIRRMWEERDEEIFRALADDRD